MTMEDVSISSKPKLTAIFALVLLGLFMLSISEDSVKAEKDNSQVEASAFFEAINLDYPGLEDVKAAVEENNYTAAKEAYLEFTINRTDVALNDIDFSYDSIIADEALDHLITYEGTTHQLDENIDWSHNPDSDPEWFYGLHRTGFMHAWAKAFHETEEDKYVEQFLYDMNDYVSENEAGFPRPLDTGLRLSSWMESHYIFMRLKDGAGWTADNNINIVNNLYQNARFLQDPTNWEDTSNHGLTSSIGHMTFAALYPEFKNSGDYFDTAFERVLHHKDQLFFSDHTGSEVGPLYVSLTVRKFMDAYVFAQESEHPRASELESDIYEFIDALVYYASPESNIFVTIGDSDYTDEYQVGNLIEYYESVFNKTVPHWEWVKTKGAEGTPPPMNSRSFEEQGLQTLRSGWGTGPSDYSDQTFMTFLNGDHDYEFHQHADVLSLTLAAYGKRLLVDPGRYIYNDVRHPSTPEDADYNYMNPFMDPNPDRRLYWVNSAAHNLVQVRKLSNGTLDHSLGEMVGINQGFYGIWRKFRGRDGGEQGDFFTSSNYDYTDGKYEDTSDSSLLNHKQSRGILYFKPANYFIVTDPQYGDDGEHGGTEFDQFWHLDAGITPEINTDTKVATMPNLVIAPSDSDSIMDRVDEAGNPVPFDEHGNRERISPFLFKDWVSAAYGEREESKTIIYRKNSQESLRGKTVFDTVLIPYDSTDIKDAPSVRVKRLPIDSEESYRASALEIEVDNFTDYYMRDDNSSLDMKPFSTFSADSKVAFVRKDSTGDIKSIISHDGTQLSDGNKNLVTLSDSGNASWSDSLVEINAPEGTTYSIFAPEATSVMTNGSLAFPKRSEENEDYIVGTVQPPATASGLKELVEYYQEENILVRPLLSQLKNRAAIVERHFEAGRLTQATRHLEHFLRDLNDGPHSDSIPEHEREILSNYVETLILKYRS